MVIEFIISFGLLFTLSSSAFPVLTKEFSTLVKCAKLGSDVAMSGFTAIAGAPGCPGLGDHKGEIFVYEVNTTNDVMTHINTLQPSDVTSGDAFGARVDIDGDYIIGAGGSYGNVGWIFERNGEVWDQSTKLEPGDGFADWFGSDVAISGTYAIVGCRRDNEADSGLNYIGAAYIFTRNSGTWTKTHKLYASDYAAGAQFGSQVDIYGDWAFIGSSGVSNPEPIYIFKYNSNDWVETQILTPGGGAFSISIDDTYAVIGSQSEGKAYIYTLNSAQTSWELHQTITGDSTEDFAADVRINGNYIIIGAPNYSISWDLQSGIAYIYKKDTSTDDWALTESLLPSAMADNDDLGRKVAIYGDYGISGCPGDNYYSEGSYSTGAVWKLSSFRDPTPAPTREPTKRPSESPSKIPTKSPSKTPTQSPSTAPSEMTQYPTQIPTKSPSKAPSTSPSKIPTKQPSKMPSKSPSKAPSKSPSKMPTASPATSHTPSESPSKAPSKSPSKMPTSSPLEVPSRHPSESPTRNPIKPVTSDPSSNPTAVTSDPSSNPSASPSDAPSDGAIPLVGVPTLCIEDNPHGVFEFKIYLDFENELLTIEIFGPSDQWFGIGFGEEMANTYAYIVSGDALDVSERMLAFHKEGVYAQSLSAQGGNDVDSSSGSADGKRYASIVRPYVLDERYDFTDFANCATELSIIWAVGQGLELSYHGQNGVATFASCTCPTTAIDPKTDDVFMLGKKMRPFIVLFPLFVVYICL